MKITMPEKIEKMVADMRHEDYQQVNGLRADGFELIIEFEGAQ